MAVVAEMLAATDMHTPEQGDKLMRAEVLEETIRLEIEQQADKFGVNYGELSPNVQSWLRSLVIKRLYAKDATPAVTPETGEEE